MRANALFASWMLQMLAAAASGRIPDVLHGADRQINVTVAGIEKEFLSSKRSLMRD
jgi:hypothetical protein